MNTHKLNLACRRAATLISTLLVLYACAGTQVNRVQPLSETADAPYGNVLVISLFKSFDTRRYLEREIVKQLNAQGVKAVASTSMMDTRTPVTRDTFLGMVESQGSDAVLVTQLVNVDTEAKFKDARAESTYNIGSTHYYNVWSVEATEYTEPQYLQFKHSVVLGIQIYSAATQQPVWGIESTTKISMNYDARRDVSVMADEAKAITRYLSRDGLLAP